MRHSIEWQDDAINKSSEERATVADFWLFLNDQNVTRHIYENVVSDHVTLALFGLVNGLVHDWWSIFGARDREFSLRNYRTGYLIPDIRIKFDGAAFDIAALQSAYDNPDLRFWGGQSEVLSRTEGEAWLSSLVDDVLQRMNAKGIQNSSAALRWARIQNSITSGEQFFCEAAGSLGLDPYQISDDDAKFIEEAEAIFDSESLIEFISGAAEVDRTHLMEWVVRMSKTTSLKYRLGDLRPLALEIENECKASDKEPAWSVGYRRARALRKKLGLSQGEYFKSFMDVAKRLGAPKSYNLAPKVNGISALRHDAHDHTHIHVRNHGDAEWAAESHLFAITRAVGDAVCFTQPQISPVNKLCNAFRQAAGRAFAAEFLAPIDEINSMRDDGLDEYSIANKFGVSSILIDHQIENCERIAEACQ